MFTSTTDVRARWMRTEDIPAVARLEFEQSSKPWSEADLQAELQVPQRVPIVAEAAGQIVGLCIYSLEDTFLRVERLTISRGDLPVMAAAFVAFVDWLKRKTNRKRTRIFALVYDWALSLQLAYKSQGFKAVKVIEDSYLFCYCEAAEPHFTPTNRLRGYFGTSE